MTISTSLRLFPAPRRMLAAQAGVVVLVLAVCAFWPRAGQAALLVPLAGDSASALDWAHAHGLSLIGTGRLRGSLVVKTGAQVPPWSALGAGALLLSVPGLTCDPKSPSAPLS